MNFITEYISQKIACESTGISEYKMLQSRKLNKPVDGFFFLFKNPLEPYHYEEVCENCGITFQCTKQRRYKNKHLFCSNKCQGEYIKSQTINNCVCMVCGKEFHAQESQIKKYGAKYCSIECHRIAKKEYMKGENNHQYGLKGDKNSSWKSDTKISYYGYRLVRMLEHPFKNSDDFVFEHRLVAEKYLLTDENKITINGVDYLSSDYHVHHLDFDRLNNSPDNLFVVLQKLHTRFHNLMRMEAKKINNNEKCKVEDLFSKEELKEKFFEFINNEDKTTQMESVRADFGSTGKK